MKHIFAKQRGTFKRWKLTLALSGAHTIGSAKPENSGYDGMWGDPANQAIFNNDYFANIVVHGWIPKRAVGGNPDKNMWILSDMSPDIEKSRQMMLNTDMCLMFNGNKPFADCMKEKGRFRKKCNSMNTGGEYLYAHKHNCCAWRGHHKLENDGIFSKDNNQGYCGL